jgi:dTDP-4-dehydrorhamnose reductase
MPSTSQLQGLQGGKPMVWVTGTAGLIGRYVVESAPRWAPQWNVQGLTRAELDLTDGQAVASAFKRQEPSVVVHCAALSRTKDCEQHPERARRINVDATARLAELCRDRPFLFVSSAEVFDGRKGWYDETDEPAPLNVYGATKLAAERIVLCNPRHVVVRIVLTAGTSLDRNRSFVEDMCRAAIAGSTVTLYADEFRCPLPAGPIARAIWQLMTRGATGLYHLGGSERLSRWEIGQLLVPWYPELEGRLAKGSARNHIGAPRPADLSLSCHKIQEILPFRLPGLRSWLAKRSRHGDDLWDYDLL